MGKLYAKKADAAPAPVNTPESESVEQVKEKKPRTEKQIAALEKAKAAREAKKAAKAEEAKKAQEETAAQEQAQKDAEEAKAAKKAAAAEKRRLKREEKKQEETPAPSESELPIKKRKLRAPKPEPELADTEQKPKRQRKIVDPDAPPKWFVGFMESAKREQVAQSGEKKSVAAIKTEVKDQAQKTWNDGYTRDRIQSAQDKHLDTMYSMMFSNRKL